MELFLLGAALAFSINIELGVVNVLIVRTAIDRGARPAFLIGLGSCIGDVTSSSSSSASTPPASGPAGLRTAVRGVCPGACADGDRLLFFSLNLFL